MCTSQCSSILDNVHLDKLSDFTKWENETNSVLKKNKNSQLYYWCFTLQSYHIGIFRSIGPYVFGLKEYYLFVFVCSCNGNTVLLCSVLQTKVGRVIEEWIIQKWPTSPFISHSSKFTIVCFINTDGGWWAFF